MLISLTGEVPVGHYYDYYNYTISYNPNKNVRVLSQVLIGSDADAHKTFN